MALIEIGNVYGHGFEDHDVARLEELGFAIRPGLQRFAGAQVVRFIDFPHGPALELERVIDAQAYADFVPEGMVPYCPGVNLVLTSDSQTSLEDYARILSERHPYRLHVNYDGSSDAAKPGWSYLNFGVPLVRDTFIWLTTHDDPRPARPEVVVHPNGVRRVRGLWFNLGTDALEPLAALAGGTVTDGALELAGVKLWSRDSGLEVPELSAKRFPLALIVLETNELKPPERGAEGAEKTRFESQPALHIRTNPLSWDLLLVERRKAAGQGLAQQRPREANEVSRHLLPRR